MRKGQAQEQGINFGESLQHKSLNSGPAPRSLAFSFGDPEPVLSSTITDYLGVFLDHHEKYYKPPVSPSGLAKVLKSNSHHCTIPYFRRNMLCKWYIENNVLTREDLGKAGFDYDVFGNAYFQRFENPFGHTLRFAHVPAINVRRLKKVDSYAILKKDGKLNKFKPGEIVHLKEYDPAQSIYGMPQYLGGLQSVLLNESATLFRRKYYDNGAHMGYIFYTADARFDENEEEEIKEQIKRSKGVGNFRSMYINIPDGKPDSVKIIPVGDIATKDEFEKIKNISRNDILSMWRIFPALTGVMPENMTGFGDIEKISRVYYENETLPAQQVFLKLNSLLRPARRIGFKTPEFAEG